MALSKTCPIFLKEKRIRQLMSDFNCSYKRALTLYVPPYSPAPSEPPRPKTDESRNIRNDLTLPSASTRFNAKTYAECARKVPKEKVKSKDNKRKKKEDKNKTGEDEWTRNEGDNISWDCFSEEDLEINIQKQVDEQTRSKERKISLQALLNKLKGIIFESEMSWKEKIQCCSDSLLQWVLSFLMQYISDWPCINFIKQWIQAP